MEVTKYASKIATYMISSVGQLFLSKKVEKVRSMVKKFYFY